MMAPIRTQTSAQLPLVPVKLLKKHHAHELHDTRFRACARLLQSRWRTEQDLPIGTFTSRGRKRRIGSLISTSAADVGRNFMTPAIAQVARRAVAYQEAGSMIDRARLFGNLLSSMPLCFNLFAPLALDRALAARIIRWLFPNLDVHSVADVWFEHSPGRRHPELTGDCTAFDVAIIYVRRDGQRGLVAFEVKYSESLQDPTPALLDPRYDALAEASGLFKSPLSAVLRVNPCQQLFRELLFAQAVIMRGDWAEATFALVAPYQNHLVQRGAELYAAHLTPKLPGQVPFVNLTLEQVVTAFGVAGEMGYAGALHDRYCAWDKVHDIFAQSLQLHYPQWQLNTLRPQVTLPLITMAS